MKIINNNTWLSTLDKLPLSKKAIEKRKSLDDVFDVVAFFTFDEIHLGEPDFSQLASKRILGNCNLEVIDYTIVEINADGFVLRVSGKVKK